MQCKIVLLMGPTGSGKSNFLDHLSPVGSKKRAKDTLSARSTSFETVRFPHPQIPNMQIIIIDTPGWEDCTPVSADIDKIMRSVPNDHPLDGILYFHNISVNRAPAIPPQVALSIKSLSHRKQSKKGTFVSTMWDTTAEEKAYTREDSLIKRTWKEVTELCDFSTARFYNTSESAWQIIDSIPARAMNYPSTSDLLLSRERGCFGCF